MDLRSFLSLRFSFVLAVLSAPPAFAQVTWRLDSLMTTWPVTAHKEPENDGSRTGVVLMPETDSAYTIIARHAGAFPVFADTMVEHYIQLLVTQRREELRVLMGVSKAYFPFLEAELHSRNLPDALKYLPMALSAMNVQCGSDHGEAGPWMLPFPDALRAGLVVNAVVDERHDLRKSTAAALARYHDLLDQYSDPGLAALALACGPGNVTRARQRSGGSSDLRSLYPHVDEAHRNLIPLWMACIFLCAQEEIMELETHVIQVAYPTDTVFTDVPLTLKRVSEALDIPLRQLEHFNPTLSAGIIPADHHLLLPAGRAKEFVPKNMEMRSPPPAEVVLVTVPDAQHPGTTTRHKVRSGESLGVIAENYGVSVASLRNWNDLRGDRIYAGQVLLIHGKLSPPGTKETMPVAEAAERKNEAKMGEPDDHTWYTVRSGDSLYLIAKKYPGVSSEDIMRYNAISANIRPGQRIKIPVAQ